MISCVVLRVAAAQDRLDLGPQPGIRHLEYRRRPGLALARPDQVGRRLPAQHQAQRRQEQALARPRLARPGAISAVELDVHVFDQRQVLNREFTKHDPVISVRTGGRPARLPPRLTSEFVKGSD